MKGIEVYEGMDRNILRDYMIEVIREMKAGEKFEARDFLSRLQRKEIGAVSTRVFLALVEEFCDSDEGKILVKKLKPNGNGYLRYQRI